MGVDIGPGISDRIVHGKTIPDPVQRSSYGRRR